MTPPVGTLLKDWRQRRRVSQLDLALEANVSARHLSFVETGRAKPSRQMVLHLASELEVPLRDRNQLLLAAGYAPVFEERPLDAPEMAPVRAALDQILAGHEPYPAVVVDRLWNVVALNAAASLFTSAVPPALLEPPVNALRLTLHPDGLAPHVVNLAEWRAHLLDRLRRQVVLTGDDAAAALLAELEGYPAPAGEVSVHGTPGELAVPLRLRTPDGELSFISTVSAFGTPADITVAELTIEAFFPADAATGAALRAKAGADRAEGA